MNRVNNKHTIPTWEDWILATQHLLLIVVLLAACSTGCSSRPPRVEGPNVDPGKVAKALVAQYNTDGDSALAAQEIELCPALAKSKQVYDVDGDGRLTTTEIENRLQQLYSASIGLFQCYAVVTLKGRPLPNATVTFVPEDSLSDVLNPASGTTDSSGKALIALADDDMPAGLAGVVKGMQTGLYRIKVTVDGKELPASIKNRESLGSEVTPADGDKGIRIAL